MVILRKLRAWEIERFSSRKDVKQLTVEYFLMSCYNMGLTRDEALANAFYEAGLYGWNSETKQAVLDGIHLAAK